MGLIHVVAVLLSLTARVGASGSIQPPHAQLGDPYRRNLEDTRAGYLNSRSRRAVVAKTRRHCFGLGVLGAEDTRREQVTGASVRPGLMAG
jgi:hypothetical protein